jgi:Asp-tRNA(Asn)/Glu-tRNA(Gln) amidotransferase A subunit family amidase
MKWLHSCATPIRQASREFRACRFRAGMKQEGLPVAIELDGPTGSDRRLLAIGVAFEQVLGSLPAPML